MKIFLDFARFFVSTSPKKFFFRARYLYLVADLL